MIPVWIGIRDEITIRFQWLSGFVCSGAGCGRGLDDFLLWRSGRCGWFRLGVETTDLKLLLVLFQDGFVVILPELLRGIFTGDALEDYTDVLAYVSLVRQHD